MCANKRNLLEECTHIACHTSTCLQISMLGDTCYPTPKQRAMSPCRGNLCADNLWIDGTSHELC